MVKKKEKDDRTLLFIGYIFWLVALIIYILKEKELSEFSRYHYLQSVALGVIGIVVGLFTLGLGGILLWLYALYLGYKVYSGEDPRPLEKYISSL